jgi:hypothetical protein
MKPVTRALQTLAAIESEFILAEAPSQCLTEPDAEIVLLIEEIGATSIGEIERLIGGCKKRKTFCNLRKSEFNETARYTKLAQTASASIEIIFDTPAPPPRQPLQKRPAV